MNDRDCENCKHHTEKGCDSWDCEFEQVMTKEDIYREEEQAYMKGYEDASKKYRQELCEDAISRQAVQDYIAKYLSQYLYPDAREAFEILDEYIGELPPVNPQEPKTGHWIEKDGFDGDVYYDCSECGESFCLIDGTPTDNLYNYCPNCGAKMEESEETE